MPPVDIQDLLDKIESLRQKIADKINWIADKINGILSHVPGFLSWVVDKFIAAWNKMLEKYTEFMAWFVQKLAYAGDPVRLWNLGDDWHTLVGEPGKTMADSIDETHELLVDDNWTGEAATAYKAQVPDQESTLRLLGQTFASTASSQLKTMAVAIVLFWTGIIAALVSLVIAIIAASAATGSVIGIPAVPFAIGAGIIAFLIAAGTGTASLIGGCLLAKEGLNNVTRYAEDWPEFALPA